VVCETYVILFVSDRCTLDLNLAFAPPWQTLRRGIDDAVQKQFATVSLQTLLERQSGTHTNQPTSYDWAISSLEILIEGEVLGSGAFGVVYTGRWQGTRVAVKQLMRGTPRQVSSFLSNSFAGVRRKALNPTLSSHTGICHLF
jgi:hypothetical protein